MAKTVQKIWGLSAPELHKGNVPAIKTVNDDLIVGIELEIERLFEGMGYYMDRAGNFWNVVEDGSLRPRGESWEFVSRPAPLGVMLAEVRELFRKLNLNEESNYSDRCSVHIHTNVLDFDQEQMAGLGLIYPVFESVLFQFINHYKKREEQGYSRDTNIYCIPWSDCRMNKNFVDNLFSKPDQIRYWQKYTALNVLPVREKGTVEWRHLHGTCDFDKIEKWANMIGAIMLYVKNTPFDEIVKTIHVMNDVSTYQQFFQEVLRGTLEYTEEYRPLLAEGVVNAKYSLIDWDFNKTKPKAKKLLYDELVDDEIYTRGVAPAPEAAPTIRVNTAPRFTQAVPAGAFMAQANTADAWLVDAELRQAMEQIRRDTEFAQAQAQAARGQVINPVNRRPAPVEAHAPQVRPRNPIPRTRI